MRSIFSEADWIDALPAPDGRFEASDLDDDAGDEALPTWDTEPAAERRWRPMTWLLFAVIVAALSALCWLAMIAIYGGDVRLASWVMTRVVLPALALEIAVIVLLVWRFGQP